jgi:hypothetical protein
MSQEVIFMLTQDAVRHHLNAIADELAHQPGIYYELFARKFSERVQHWIHSVPHADAELIEFVAQNDPDYLAVADELDAEIAATIAEPTCEPLFNPDWDVSY